MKKAKCIKNNNRNVNFTVGKEYELSESGIRSNWGGMWINFAPYNKPKSFQKGDRFFFAACEFQIVDNNNVFSYKL